MRPASGTMRGVSQPPDTLTHPLLAAMGRVADLIGGRVVGPDELADGDVPLEWGGSLIGGFRPATLHGALDRMIANQERLMGASVAEMTREQKQELVGRLDAQGAFTLRYGVELVADALGVSRFTVYNYVNALRREPSARR
jgi:hypothetical protein